MHPILIEFINICKIFIIGHTIFKYENQFSINNKRVFAMPYNDECEKKRGKKADYDE